MRTDIDTLNLRFHAYLLDHCSCLFTHIPKTQREHLVTMSLPGMYGQVSVRIADLDSPGCVTYLLLQIPKNRPYGDGANVGDLDNFLVDVYDYYILRGYWSVLLKRLLKLLSDNSVAASENSSSRTCSRIRQNVGRHSQICHNAQLATEQGAIGNRKRKARLNKAKEKQQLIHCGRRTLAQHCTCVRSTIRIGGNGDRNKNKSSRRLFSRLTSIILHSLTKCSAV